jgi:hypothetical protein
MKSRHPPRRLAIQEARAWAAGVRVGEPHAKSVLLALAYYVNDEFTCYVSIDLLASDIEVHPDTVRRRLVLLEQIGAIVRTPQWVENGQRNAERRGKRTTDLIKLQVDVDPSSIKPRVVSPNGTIVIDSSTGHSDEEANSDFSPGTPPGPRHDAGHRSALAQPLHYSKDLTSEHEQEDSPPSPPPGGSCEVDAEWKEFIAAWSEPILKATVARELWRKLTQKEKSEAIAAARGYSVWRKKQRNPPRYSAQSFLRERDAWPQFAALAGPPAASLLRVFEAVGSKPWLARVVIAKIVGTSAPVALDLPEGRGGRFNQLSEAHLTLAQFAEQDAATWQFVGANRPECIAWCRFLKIEPRPIVVATTTKEFNGREYLNWPIKEYGLWVPRPLPPQQRQSGKQGEEQQSQISAGAVRNPPNGS